MFRADGHRWGAAGMVRGGSDFTDRETDFLAAVGPAMAARDPAGRALRGPRAGARGANRRS